MVKRLLVISAVCASFVAMFAGVPTAADLIVTGPAGPQALVENQGITVKNGGVVQSDTLGVSAIAGSQINEGGNTFIVEDGGEVIIAESVGSQKGIRLFGTRTDNSKSGLAGGGSLADGAANILNLHSGSIVKTDAYDGAVGVSNNNLVVAAGRIETAKSASDCIVVSGNNNDITMSGDFSTVMINSDGIWGGAASNNVITLSGSIRTAGDTADGIDFSEGFKNAITVSGSIETSGQDSEGVELGGDSMFTLTGSLHTTGETAHGIYAYLGGNTSHLSGMVSATGLNAYAIQSGDSDGTGESSVYHLLDGVSLTGGIHNGDSNDNQTSYLTFGFAKDSNDQAQVSQADSSFTFTTADSITSDSTGAWDGYVAGGTLTLNGDTNAFRNIFIGGDAFTSVTLNDGQATRTNIARIDGATAILNVSKAISTSGALQVGAGSIYNLSGTHTHQGAAPTLEGTLHLDGGTFTSTNGLAALGAGGVVTGSGSIGLNGTTWTTGGNGGTIQATGVMTISNGALVVSPDDTAAVGIDSGGNVSSLTVSGAADFTGAQVAVNASGGAANTDYVLIQSSALTLAPDDVALTDNSGLFDYTVAVGGTALTVSTSEARFEPIAATSSPANTGMAAVLSRNFSAHPAEQDTLFQRFSEFSSTEQVSEAMTQLQPMLNTAALAHSGVQQANIAMGHLFDAFCQGKSWAMDGFRFSNLGNASAKPFVDGSRNEEVRLPVHGWRSFAGVYTGGGRQDREDTLSGYDYGLNGVLCGTDYGVSPTSRVGILLGFSKGDADIDGSADESDDEMIRLGTYARFTRDNFFFDSAATVGAHSLKTSRRIDALNTEATSRRTAYDLSWYNRLGFDVNAWGGVTLSPSYALAYTRLSDPGYTEEDGSTGTNLTVNSETNHSLTHDVTLKAGRSWTFSGDLVFHPEVWVGGQWEQCDPYGTVTSAFSATPSDTWTTDASKPGDDRLILGASATLLMSDKDSFVLRYDRAFRNDGYDFAVNLAVKVVF